MRLLPLLLCLLLLFTLVTACTGQQAADTAGDSTTASEAEVDEELDAAIISEQDDVDLGEMY